MDKTCAGADAGIAARRIGAKNRSGYARSPMADDEHATPRFAATPTRTEYAVTKGAVALAVYRKRMGYRLPASLPAQSSF